MEDFNAKVGNTNEHFERTKEGLGEMYDNGNRLAEYCSENDLIITGTYFQHKDIHKATRTSPDGRTNNQIDHVIINRKYRRYKGKKRNGHRK